ncbi:MAG: DUF6923 family protein [Planctomycetota bacterium]
MRSASILLAGVLTLAYGGGALGAPIFAASFDSDSLYEIDMASGQVSSGLAFVDSGGAPVDFTEGGLSLSPGGQLYGSFAGALDALYTIDVNSGVVVEIGLLGFLDVSAIAFAPDGTLFGLDSAADQLIVIDTATGQGQSVVNGIGMEIGAVAGMGFSSDGSLYFVDAVTDTLYRFDDPHSGGAPTEIGVLAGLGRPAALTFAEENGEETLFVVDAILGGPSRLYTVSGYESGSPTPELVDLADPMPEGVGGLTGVIPEPATMLLLGVGALAIRRRRG